jgi:hypothetical protein
MLTHAQASAAPAAYLKRAFSLETIWTYCRYVEIGPNGVRRDYFITFPNSHCLSIFRVVHEKHGYRHLKTLFAESPAGAFPGSPLQEDEGTTMWRERAAAIRGANPIPLPVRSRSGAVYLHSFLCSSRLNCETRRVREKRGSLGIRRNAPA